LPGKVLELESVLQPDQLATRLIEMWLEWDSMRNVWKRDKEEVRRYVYATDTTQTTNSQNPWKNKTTIPKLCQISDNLYSNYTATLFPQRKWLIWEANEADSNSKNKRDAITNYMSWVISQPMFKHELDKVILDYIHYGNCFVTVDWLDQRVQVDNKTQAGFVGPVPRRISPMDIVMNPTAENFLSSPKIVRSIISLGELRDLLERMSTSENQQEYKDLYNYLKEIRNNAAEFHGDWIERDHMYKVDGFSSFREYLNSEVAEIFTFYGDYYDKDNDTFVKNHVVTVVDRHKLIGKKPNPSFFGYPPIYHAPWRKRQDNLWGMGPLDNLVGMQYRMDHVENMRADVVDLGTFPVQKVKGFVQEFVWQPGEKIFMGEEGDVELVVPDTQLANVNFELQNIERLMEEMAGAPKEAMGFRTPGEKTKYEVQRLENAAARIFQNKIKQFEEQVVEPLLNAMLELARRNMSSATTISVFNDEFASTTFQTLTVEDITGIGRIKPVAARHFAEQAELIQNLTSLSQSNLWPLVQPHFSGVKTAKMLESNFNMEDYGLVTPYVGISEQAEGQKLANTFQKQVFMAAGTASGMNGDYDLSQGQGLSPQGQQMMGAPQ
jgi:hypothetical protein